MTFNITRCAFIYELLGGGSYFICFYVNVEESGACFHPSGLEAWNKSPANFQMAADPGCELLPGTAQRASLHHLAAAKTSASRGCSWCPPAWGRGRSSNWLWELWVRPLWQSRSWLASSPGLQDAPLEQGQWSVASPLSVRGGNAVHWMIPSTPMAYRVSFCFDCCARLWFAWLLSGSGCSVMSVPYQYCSAELVLVACWHLWYGSFPNMLSALGLSHGLSASRFLLHGRYFILIVER